MNISPNAFIGRRYRLGAPYNCPCAVLVRIVSAPGSPSRCSYLFRSTDNSADLYWLSHCDLECLGA